MMQPNAFANACLPRSRVCAPLLAIVFVVLNLSGVLSQTQSPQLVDLLAKESGSQLAAEARRSGDASRGALLFYRPEMACSRCHGGGEDVSRLGPDLATPSMEVDPAKRGEHIVESLLFPSRQIKKGYETLAITTKQGKIVTGLFERETPEQLILKDAGQDGQRITIDKMDIEERDTKKASLMPEGLVNILSGKREFLDLVRFLIDIQEKGPEFAKLVRPAASLFAPPPIPAYENDLDHAGLLSQLDQKSFERGRDIYTRVCANCHGTLEQPGSIPSSLRFGQGKFKSGHDPLGMYRTLTHGYGMMTPQSWMVPRQKYDVIHYIRETFLKPHNPSFYVSINPGYLASLPKGKNPGPNPSTIEPWVSMNYGPSLMATLEVGNKGNFAFKGISVRLDNGPGGISRGRQWMLYDEDTMRVAAAWEGDKFIDFRGINFNGEHQIHPRVVGKVHFANNVGPGWANPQTQSFDDPRPKGRDGKPYGPLPREWTKYKGIYHFANQTIVAYSVGDANILEMPAFEMSPEKNGKPGEVITSRILNVGKSSRDLFLRVAPTNKAVNFVGSGASLIQINGDYVLKINSTSTPTNIKVLQLDGPDTNAARNTLDAYAKTAPLAPSLDPFTRGGPARWPEKMTTTSLRGSEAGPFAIDVLTHPVSNPWNAQMRLTGFDFYPDGSKLPNGTPVKNGDYGAVCSWDGDVWLVGGLTSGDKLTWQRIASGLFQPLGLKIVGDKIHVSCRDQIVILRDLNGDNETDYYECFNNDHQVTDHFHEFAMGLQTDEAGNFYYAKSARHALKALVPHHGTLLKVSKDGSTTEILANGFRAANGVCLNPDGTFYVTDQEGFWLPKNRINRVEKGSFNGNFWGYTDVTDPSDEAMTKPLCWITNEFDRSPSELLWVTSDKWEPVKGSLLNFSYGYGKIYVVTEEKVGGIWQGGMSPLPLPQFPTGLMRGRFHPNDGQLYCCGMFAWAGNQTQPGGFYRLRYTGKPVQVPLKLEALETGMRLTFSGPLDREAASKVTNYAVKTWGLKRSQQYGSKHYDEKPSTITGLKVSPDGTQVFLEIEGMKPTWCMEITFAIKAADGAPVTGTIHNTIHVLGK